MTLFRCIDFETTGLPDQDGETHGIVEVGTCDLAPIPYGRRVMAPIAVLTDPGRPIPAGASAVHHILDADVEGAMLPADALSMVAMPPPDYWVAHNADYEKLFFDGAGIPWICTYKVACRVWPDAASHGLQFLRYWLNLPADREVAEPAHRAGGDAYVTAHLLNLMLSKGCEVEDMVRWSGGPALKQKIGFGKHKGERWDAVPLDYLDWVADKSDLKSEDKANARYWRRRRQEAAQANYNAP